MDPSLLPKLPGYSFRDPTQTNFRKQHMFDVKAESQAESTILRQENVDSLVVNSLQTGPARQPYEREERPLTPKNKAIPREPPAWLKFDRQVLRFYAYFQEAVHENPSEQFRVRKCVIQHFLEDETTYVFEPKIENSGIPQGVFIKRHRIPLGDSHYKWNDFALGSNVDFYSRVFRVIDCDGFTAQYFREQGQDIGVAEDYPGDTFGTTRVMMNFKQAPADAMDVKEYNEVKLGGGHPNRNLKSFIDNDRKTLSFHVMWNDTSYDGGLKYYTLNYFLSDKTIEIKELRQVNTGNETFPMMLKRMKVPKEPILTPCPALSLRDSEYYTEYDLIIGNKGCPESNQFQRQFGFSGARVTFDQKALSTDCYCRSVNYQMVSRISHGARRSDRQAHDETCAQGFGRDIGIGGADILGPDHTAVGFDDLLRDRQAQARVVAEVIDRTLGIEAVEYLGQRLFGDAGAGVFDHDQHAVFAFPDPDADSVAIVTKGNCVGQKVDEDLCQAGFKAFDHDFIAGHIGDELDTLFARFVAQVIGQVADHVQKIEGRFVFFYQFAV